MKTTLFTLVTTAFFLTAKAQVADTVKNNEPLNAINAMIYNPSEEEKKLTLSSYGEVQFTQQFGDTLKHNSSLNVPRLILFMGYKFNPRTHFVSEIEFENVNQIFVEQAFLNYKLKSWADFRAGLMLIPMGIINEYHEPTRFNGTLRPGTDTKIVPTTWREIGMGFSGKFDKISLKYQLYVVNGFNGYDVGGKFRGEDGLREGRQKGVKSYMTAPDFSAKTDYYGIKGLKLGVAAYVGESESKLFEGLWESDPFQNKKSQADSSVVGITMFGLDARYEWKGFEAKAEYVTVNLFNTTQYNKLAGKDLGSMMIGYYVEAGYNVLQEYKKAAAKLVVFARYDHYNTQTAVTAGTIKNELYNRTDITVGAGFSMAEGTVLKADYQRMLNAKAGSAPKNMFNAGIGIWF